MIAIIDYGLGNVNAFANVYKMLNIPAAVVNSADDLKNADKLILPGVGAFDHAMQQLEKSGFRGALDEAVLKRHLPVLGVCVGMQMLSCASEEGSLPGLGWIDGVVKRFDPETLPHTTRLPHMGWNDVCPVMETKLFEGIEEGARFYFLHSYYFCCNNEKNVFAVTEYGGSFASAVCSGNIYGVQFHPEKSHQWGGAAA
ncbi:imidazole glycerol phosphate synthase subunit HisH [Thermodesulfobacteriota bacterium]